VDGLVDTLSLASQEPGFSPLSHRPACVFRTTVGESGNSSFDLIAFGKNLEKQIELSIMNWACFKSLSKCFRTAFGVSLADKKNNKTYVL
jgi:hypothetical protein